MEIELKYLIEDEETQKKMWNPSGFCFILTTMSLEPTEKKKVVSSSTIVVIFFLVNSIASIPFYLKMIFSFFECLDDRNNDQGKDTCRKTVVV